MPHGERSSFLLKNIEKLPGREESDVTLLPKLLQFPVAGDDIEHARALGRGKDQVVGTCTKHGRDGGCDVTILAVWRTAT